MTFTLYATVIGYLCLCEFREKNSVLQRGGSLMSSMMAAEPWNKVNIPFPGALSSVIIHITDDTDENVDQLLLENDKVLLLLRSQILQTEVRVLYELLYVLHYSTRGNRTIRALKQVEQCINRLKEMKLDAALQDLADLCPTKFQRELSMHSKGIECDVPSQPMLEWLCLKVLGAAQLMSRTMTHCGRAFTLSKQTLKWEEFIVLNVVITAMLSRLWVFFRGILANLAPLYMQILRLLGEVSQVRPMPYLQDYSLPEDMVQFLGPSEDETSSLMMSAEPLPSASSAVPDLKATRGPPVRSTRKEPPKIYRSAKVEEEERMGVPVKRVGNIDGKTLCKDLFKDFTEESTEPESSTQDAAAVGQKEMFHKQVTVAATFTELAAHLENTILWYRSHRLRRETRLLSFVHLRCRKMKHLESAGFNVQRKLRRFKQEACWASSPTGSVPASFRSSVSALRRRAHHRTRFPCLRERFNHRTARVLHAESSPYESHGERTELPVFQKPARRTQVMDLDVPAESGENATSSIITPSLSVSSHDEIDDIFGSVGF